MKNDKNMVKENLNEESKFSNKNNLLSDEKYFDENIRTRFSISFLFLILEVFIPFIVLWLLTGKDFYFSFNISTSLAIGFSFVFIIFSIFLTMFFYLLKLHKNDQFTYVTSLSFTLATIYLTSFWWIDHLLFRLLIAILFLIIGLTIGVIISAIFYNIKLKNSN